MSLTPTELRYDGAWIEVCRRRAKGACICGYHTELPRRDASVSELRAVNKRLRQLGLKPWGKGYTKDYARKLEERRHLK